MAGFFLLRYGPAPEYQVDDTHYISIDNVKVKVDFALTPEEQARGLSGRVSLGENEGMLFVFPAPGRHYFWMQDMRFPIDIIWVGEDKHVIFVEKNASPASFPNSFGPNADSKYVLEVNAGFADLHYLKVGDEVQLDF